MRISQSRDFAEKVSRFLGLYPMRCKNCDARFRGSIWAVTEFIYARCPRCYRTTLTTWDPRYYAPGPMTVFLMSLGAKRVRCDACRYNFVSFRRVKNYGSWRKANKHTQEALEEDIE